MDRRVLRIGIILEIALVFVFTTTVLPQVSKPRSFVAPGAGSYVFDRQWGNQGSLNDEFNGPNGIAVAPSGDVFVADTSNHRIAKFDANGNFLSSFGGSGSGPGQFSSPYGIAADAAGNLWVADTHNGRVQKLDANGTRLCEAGGFTTPYGIAVDRTSNTVFVTNSGVHTVVRLNSACVNRGSWGSMGSADGQFSTPWGITVDSSSQVYVVDSGNYRIQKFKASGAFLSAWGVFGTGDSRFTADPEFYTPAGIYADPCGGIFVVDQYNHRIQKFQTDGTFVTMWGTFGSGAGEFNYPIGIAGDGQGRIYVVEPTTHRVQRFSPGMTDLTYLFADATGGVNAGSGDGEFSSPYGIAVAPSGEVYVADTNNHRIQKFNPTGLYLMQWGEFGTGNGQLYSPYGIAVAPGGEVYVVDTYNNRIQKFSASGRYITQWGSLGSASGQFNYPSAIAVASNGDVYVADTLNHRVQQFTSAGVFLRGIGHGTTWTGMAPAPDSGNLNRWFSSPWGVVVDSMGAVLVADQSNRRVQKFTSTGSFVGKWGSNESVYGGFANPAGLAVDSSDNVYVADSSRHIIQKFATDGRFLATWSSFGSLNGLLYSPYGVAVAPAGDQVYVLDSSNHRFQRFERFGFTVQSDPVTRMIVRPDITTYDLQIDGAGPNTDGNPAAACLLSGLPANTTANFAPPSVIPSDSAIVTSTLSIDTSTTTPLGTQAMYVQISAGGQTRVVPISLQVKDGSPVITDLKSAPTPFSPNEDGKRDATTITASFYVPLNWTLDIKRDACPGTTVVRRFTGSAANGLFQVWGGTNASGVRVADGIYSYVVSGTTPGSLAAAPVCVAGKVDRTKPTISSLSASPDPFTPVGGGTTTLNYTLSEDAKVTIKIYSGSDLKRTLLNKAARLAGANTTDKWDGKANNGSILPAGTYTYKITAEDAALNKSTTVSGQVTIN